MSQYIHASSLEPRHPYLSGRDQAPRGKARDDMHPAYCPGAAGVLDMMTLRDAGAARHRFDTDVGAPRPVVGTRRPRGRDRPRGVFISLEAAHMTAKFRAGGYWREARQPNVYLMFVAVVALSFKVWSVWFGQDPDAEKVRSRLYRRFSQPKPAIYPTRPRPLIDLPQPRKAHTAALNSPSMASQRPGIS
jgi:hypothetical protein